MVLTTAGICIGISWAHEMMSPVFETFLNSFSITNQEPEFSLSISGDFKEKIHRKKPTTEDYAVFECKDGFLLERRDVRLSVSFVTNSIKLSLSPRLGNLQHMIGECLKWIYSFLIIYKGGVPLHCSVAYRSDNGYGFLGSSEIGKTTFVKLLQPVWKIGNDEFNAIMPAGDHYILYATPFKASIPCTMSMAQSVRASRLFFLKQCTMNYVENMPSKKKYFDLLKNVYTIPASQFLGDKLLENIQNVCDTVPMQMLYFINNITVVDFFNHFLQSQEGGNAFHDQ